MKREIQLPLKLLSGKTLNLGYVGENLYTEVVINCSEVLWDYPDATVSMIVRPPSGPLYPVTPVLDGEGNIKWTVTASDLIYAGTGQIQLTFLDGEEIIKSAIGSTQISASLETTGDAPEPLQNWMDEAEETAARIAEEAAQQAVEDIGLTATLITGNQYRLSL